MLVYLEWGEELGKRTEIERRDLPGSVYTWFGGLAVRVPWISVGIHGKGKRIWIETDGI